MELKRGAKVHDFVRYSSASSCPVSRSSRRALVVSFTPSDVGLADTYTCRSCAANDQLRVRLLLLYTYLVVLRSIYVVLLSKLSVRF